MFRQQPHELGWFRQENRKLLAQVAAQSDPTNQVSAEDQFTLQQTHVVDAMTTLINAIKNYATNHNGQFPGDLDPLAASGDLGASSFAGNLGLAGFEIPKDGVADREGNKVILRLCVPLRRAGGVAVMVSGGIGDGGVTHTSIVNVSPDPNGGLIRLNKTGFSWAHNPKGKTAARGYGHPEATPKPSGGQPVGTRRLP